MMHSFSFMQGVRDYFRDPNMNNPFTATDDSGIKSANDWNDGRSHASWHSTYDQAFAALPILVSEGDNGDDDDDEGQNFGGRAGWPSTTGNRSGGGRDNA